MSKPNGKDEHATHITANDNGHTRTEVFREISQIKMTSIVCTPARLVDLLEHIDGMFTLRETTFTFGGRGTHVAVAAIPLQRHELEKLGGIIPRVLADDEESLQANSETKGGTDLRIR